MEGTLLGLPWETWLKFGLPYLVVALLPTILMLGFMRSDKEGRP